MRSSIFIASVWVLLNWVLTTTMSGRAAQSVASSIADRYRGKLVTLIGPYCGQDLKLDAWGNLLSGGESGEWQNCQGIRILDVEVRGTKLRVAAQRVRIFYDCDSGQLRDVSGTGLDENKKPEINKTITPGQEVSIEVEFPSYYDKGTASDLMKRAFRTVDADPLLDMSSPRKTSTASSGRIYRVGLGVTPPIPIYQPDPSYSEKARQAKREGTVMLNVIIGPDGRVHHAAVTRSVGMGLDEDAIEKVMSWRFTPASLCGKPVAVEVSVEITFNLK